MPGSSLDYGPLNESIHLADGSHRAHPPAGFTGDVMAWVRERDEHVAQHVKEALEANADLKDPEDQLVRELADQASQKTEGMVFLIEKSRRDGMVSFTFRGLPERLDREDTIRSLLYLLREPRGL